jgi:hypothetical protein
LLEVVVNQRNIKQGAKFTTADFPAVADQRTGHFIGIFRILIVNKAAMKLKRTAMTDLLASIESALAGSVNS